MRVLFMLFCSVPLLYAADIPSGRTVEITVADSLTVAANGVEVEMLIKKNAEIPDDARKTCGILIRDILDTLQRSGMKVLDSRTGMVTGYPGFAASPAPDEEVEVTARLTVRMAYAGGLDVFARKVMSLDSDLLVERVAYFHTSEESLKTVLVERAAAVARTRRKAYEKAFGVSLQVQRIVEEPRQEFVPPPGGISLEGGMASPAGTIKEPAGDEVPIVTRHLCLTVTYRITGK